MKNSIRIGVDIDDCMCNTLEMDFCCAYYKYKKLNKLHDDIDKTYFDVTKSFNIENGDQFFIKEKQYIMKHNDCMYPKVFVAEVLKKLIKKGFEIVIITSRADKFWNGNSKRFAKKWLRKYKIPYNKIYTDVVDKSQVCLQEKIDLMIEDNHHNVININNTGIKSILLKTTYNKNYANSLNIFAENWLDVYSILAKIYNFNGNDIINL